MNIGDKIKENRLKKEWTQEQLAQLLNVSRSAVSGWEVGRNYPDLETVIAISDLFHLPLDNLLREEKEMSKDLSKKVKMHRYYKRILIVLGILALVYGSFNLKLRVDETRYRGNLIAYGWKHPNPTDEFAKSVAYNSYEKIENGIHYNTFVLPAGLIGYPMKDQKINLITKKEGFIVTVEDKRHFSVMVNEEQDEALSFTANVPVDRKGLRIENKSQWSDKKAREIDAYLEKYQEIHQELIETSLVKRQEIVGKGKK